MGILFRMPGGPTDQYFSSVVSLLHLDTNISDVKGAVWSNPQPTDAYITAAASKFGGGSLRCSNGGKISTPTSANWAFGTADFTVEAYVYANSYAYMGGLLGNYDGSTGTWVLHVDPSGTLNWYHRNGVYVTTPTPLTSNVWQHIAYSRNSGTGRLFVDGALAVSVSDTGNYLSGAGDYNVGATFGMDPFDGYIDEVRVTKGVARYTANFTPPTAAFPNN